MAKTVKIEPLNLEDLEAHIGTFADETVKRLAAAGSPEAAEIQASIEALGEDDNKKPWIKQQRSVLTLALADANSAHEIALGKALAKAAKSYGFEVKGGIGGGGKTTGTRAPQIKSDTIIAALKKSMTTAEAAAAVGYQGTNFSARLASLAKAGKLGKDGDKWKAV